MVEKRKTIRDIDKPFYGYWQALYHSFYDSRLYVDVGKRWKGYGVTYFLLLMFIVTLPFAIRVAHDFKLFFNEKLIQPFEQLPPLYIQNGLIISDKPMPYVIKNENNQTVAIVDTTGTITEIDKSYPDLNILITKDKLLYRFPTPRIFFNPDETLSKADSEKLAPVYVYPFNKTTNSVFKGRDWIAMSHLTQLRTFFSVLVYPISALIFFFMFVVLFLALALMGQFVAKYLFNLPIRYQQTCRLLLVSATPFMLVLWIAIAFNKLPSGFGFILVLLLALYFSYALISFRRDINKLVIS